MEIACLDLGSNTFHLQHFQPIDTIRLTSVLDCKQTLRLGASVSRTGGIDGETWDAGIGAVRDLLAQSRARGPQHLCVVATSAIRSARNGGSFLSELTRQFEIEVEMLDGLEEARLSYLGASAEREYAQDCIAVIDLGGGSTELTVGRGMSCMYVDSLPLGVLGLAAYFQERTYTREGVLEMTSDLKRRFGRRIALAAGLRPRKLIFASGAARAVHQLVASSQAEAREGGQYISLQNLYGSLERVAGLTPAELSAMGVEAGRLDTVRLGHVAMIAIMECFGSTSAWVSDAGLRYGVAVRECRKLAQAAATAA